MASLSTGMKFRVDFQAKIWHNYSLGRDVLESDRGIVPFHGQGGER